MMASHTEMEVKGGEAQQPEGSKCLKFVEVKNFYDQINFSAWQSPNPSSSWPIRRGAQASHLGGPLEEPIWW